MAWWHNKTRALVKNSSDLEDFLVYVALGVVLGGRVGYCLFYGLDVWLSDPLWVFKIWSGGMSFHGGFLGVCLGVLLFSRKHKIDLGDCADFVAVVVPIGIFCGRVGNFINQELWGRPSDVPWAVVFSADPNLVPRHPTQLYEAALEGIVLFIILKYCYARKLPKWGVSMMFLLAYGLMRFAVEWLREPDAPIWWSLTRGQWLCLPLIAIGLWWVVNTYLQAYMARAHK